VLESSVTKITPSHPGMWLWTPPPPQGLILLLLRASLSSSSSSSSSQGLNSKRRILRQCRASTWRAAKSVNGWSEQGILAIFQSPATIKKSVAQESLRECDSWATRDSRGGLGAGHRVRPLFLSLSLKGSFSAAASPSQSFFLRLCLSLNLSSACQQSMDPFWFQYPPARDPGAVYECIAWALQIPSSDTTKQIKG